MRLTGGKQKAPPERGLHFASQEARSHGSHDGLAHEVVNVIEDSQPTKERQSRADASNRWQKALWAQEGGYDIWEKVLPEISDKATNAEFKTVACFSALVEFVGIVRSIGAEVDENGREMMARGADTLAQPVRLVPC